MERVTEIELKNLILPVVEKHEAFLVDIISRGERGDTVIQVYVDTDPGITVDTLGKISREIRRHIDESIKMPENFRLDVSSPGLDQPLKLGRQYRKNIGRELEVNYVYQGEMRKISGILSQVNDEGINLQIKKGDTLYIPYTDISSACTKLPW